MNIFMWWDKQTEEEASEVTNLIQKCEDIDFQLWLQLFGERNLLWVLGLKKIQLTKERPVQVVNPRWNICSANTTLLLKQAEEMADAGLKIDVLQIPHSGVSGLELIRVYKDNSGTGMYRPEKDKPLLALSTLLKTGAIVAITKDTGYYREGIALLKETIIKLVEIGRDHKAKLFLYELDEDFFEGR